MSVKIDPVTLSGVVKRDGDYVMVVFSARRVDVLQYARKYTDEVLNPRFAAAGAMPAMAVAPRPPLNEDGTHMAVDTLHMTLAINGQRGDVFDQDKIAAFMELYKDKKVDVTFDPYDMVILPGQPKNDIGTGVAYYIGMRVSNLLAVRELRSAMGLDPEGQSIKPHVTAGGLMPAVDYAAFRASVGPVLFPAET